MSEPVPAPPQSTNPPQLNPVRAVLADDRIVLPLGSLLALGVVGGGVALLGGPAWTYRAGIEFQQPHGIVILGATLLLCAFASLLAAMIASHRHYEGGVFCGGAALAFLAYRFGPMRFALFAAGGRGIYFSAAIELCVLFIGIAMPALLLWTLSVGGWLPADLSIKQDEPTDQKLMAVAIHTIAMILLTLILCQTDRIFQTLASVFVAGYVAALVSRAMIPVNPSLWLLLGPLLTGVIGYIVQGITASGLANGDPSGLLVALARTTPLAYAGAGTMGTLLGYWHAVDRQDMSPAQIAADIAFGTAEVVSTVAK